MLGGRGRERRPDSGARAQQSVPATVWPLVAAGIGILLAAIVTLTILGQSARDQRWQQQARGQAETLARALAEQAQGERDRLASLARSPDLVGALGDSDQEALGGLARTYHAAFPQSLRLLIVPGNSLNPAPRADPPIGYALVEQVQTAIGEGDASAEIHLPGGPDAHLNMVAPVRDGEDTLGVLVLSYPLTPFDRLLTPLDGAYLWLEQRSVSGTTEVLALGNPAAEGPTFSTRVGDTVWDLHYRAARGVPPLAGIPPLLLGGVVAAGVLLLALLGWMLHDRLRRALRADGDTFAQLLRDLVAGTMDAPYRARTRELEPGLEAAAIQAHALQAARADKRQRSRDVADAGPEPATAPSTDGLEVTEGDPADLDMEPPSMSDTPNSESEQPTAAVAVDPSIFRSYDIRGVVDRTLTVDAVRAIGHALGSEAAARGQSEVVVGYDGRHSSPALAAALAEGLNAAGRDVIDIGQVPTPVVYFAAHHLGTQAGIAVTGSHNPPDYNGLKMVIGGETLWGEAIQALRRRIAGGDLTHGEGNVRKASVLIDYIDRIAGDVTLERPLKLAIDCGNGVAGAVAPDLFRALGCEVDELYCEVDGDFPNHHPDPTVPENLEDLILHVRVHGSDLGIAFDGDGDRLGVVDNRGKVIWADRQMMLFARDVLGRNPGSDIIFDVKCTSLLADVIAENAGVPVMWKTGHSLIKDKLRETGAPLAGEMSGHIFFKERWYGFDDGLYAGARLLEILAADPRPSDAVFADLPEGVSTPEIRVDLEEGEPPRIIETLLEDTADLRGAQLTTIDGLRLDLPDSWGLVRASNTQPCLVLRFEGTDEQALERIQAMFRERLAKAKPGIELPF